MTSRCSKSVGGAGQWQPGGECSRLLKDPGIADRSSSDRYTIDAGVVDHVETCLGIKQVATPEYDAFASVLFQLAQEFPARGTLVRLREQFAHER